MDIFQRVFFAIGLASILAVVACSSDSTSSAEGENVPVHGKTVSGLAQKGPFLDGSTVTLYELDEATLEKTGKSFSGNVSGGRGEFSVPDVELASPYALLEVHGDFLRESSFSDSVTESMTLYALTRLGEREKVNVNLLSHLECRRVLRLVREGGLAFSDAKRQALNEILSAFGFETTDKNSEDLSIFGKTEEDAELLFLSARFSSIRDDVRMWTVSMDSLAGNFARDLEDGVWDDDSLRFGLAEGFPAETIRQRLNGWGYSDTIPDIEKYYEIFWQKVHAFPLCGNDNFGEVLMDSLTYSRYRISRTYICRDGGWEQLAYAETELGLCTESIEDSIGIVKGDHDRKFYQCKNETWTEISRDGYLGAMLGNCTEESENKTASLEDGEFGKTDYVCQNGKWEPI